LLEELAAKVYEYEKYRGIQFRIQNASEGTKEAIFDIEVINHFYVLNASVNRK